MRLPSLWLVLLGLAPGCRSHPFGEIDRASSGAQLDLAEADVRAGEHARALERLAEVHQVENLEPDQRQREERLIDQAARGRFAQLQDAPADELVELFDSELPERVRARAGILAADRMLAEGRRITAYRQVKKVDEKVPGHPERVLAGDVLARAGLSLIQDDGRYNLLFHYRPRGVQALEYLVVHYPLEQRCPQAYFALSEVYERDGDFDQAIERSEELLLYHPESPYAPAASARLPYLRLCRLGRDDYDRGELLRARGELAAWLERYPGHELAGWVGDLVRECQARIVRSDLYLAEYYEHTGTRAGQRLHAERARSLALEAGLEDEAAAAERMLAPLGRADGAQTAAAPPERP
jgi:tetratricopeptide (TPR) repeat protein